MLIQPVIIKIFGQNLACDVFLSRQLSYDFILFVLGVSLCLEAANLLWENGTVRECKGETDGIFLMIRCYAIAKLPFHNRSSCDNILHAGFQ